MKEFNLQKKTPALLYCTKNSSSSLKHEVSSFHYFLHMDPSPIRSTTLTGTYLHNLTDLKRVNAQSNHSRSLSLPCVRIPRVCDQRRAAAAASAHSPPSTGSGSRSGRRRRSCRRRRTAACDSRECPRDRESRPNGIPAQEPAPDHKKLNFSG
jgi:hypothetical protein